MVTNFCRVSGDAQECRAGYFWTMFVLLLIYMPIDVVGYLVVKKAHEERAGNAPKEPKGQDFGTELKAHNMN